MMHKNVTRDYFEHRLQALDWKYIHLRGSWYFVRYFSKKMKISPWILIKTLDNPDQL